MIPHNVHAAVQDEIDARNKQIAEIQAQIDEYQKQITTTSTQAKTLATEVSRLNALISKIQLEVKGLSLQINQTDSEIGVTQDTISSTLAEIDLHKKALGDALVEIYRLDQQNLTQMIIARPQLSDFLNTVKVVDESKNTLHDSIESLKNLKLNLEQKQSDLEDKKSELQKLKILQQSQQSNLNQSKSSKDQLLKETKGQEAKYQQLVKESQDQIKRIKDQIYYLNQQGVTVEDAISQGKRAAAQNGIRPAFLIAILEVESRLGNNVGSGNWNDDMYLCYLRLAKIYPSKATYYKNRAETEKTAFFKVIGDLGLDPATVKVSKEPSYGCGGAMGPAQFIPSTWVAYKPKVEAIVGHFANPWNIGDAFMAAGIKLAAGGATGGRDGEIRAAKAYLSGNASCTSSICNYYANLALDKAAIIEANL